MSDAPTVLPAISRLTPDSTLKEVITSDAERSEAMLDILTDLWKVVETPNAAMKLIKETFKAMEYRRKLMCMPYGAENKKSEAGYLIPLD